MEDAKEPTGDKNGKDDLKSRIRSKTSTISEKIQRRIIQKQQSSSTRHVPPTVRPESSSTKSRTNSISSNVTASDEQPEEKRKRKRQRARNKDKHDSQSTGQLLSSVKLDAESELIITLLSLRPAKREEVLLRKAEERDLIVFNKATKTYTLNDKLLGSASGSTSSSSGAKKEKPKQLELSKSLKFESWVNCVILEGIDSKDHWKYNFPFQNRDYKLPPTELYINQPEFVSKLGKHAEYCVKENLGEIIEGEIRISNCNYYHAFVTRNEPNGKKDAMISSKVARKFALNGDIVKCFVRNQGKHSYYIFVFSFCL